MGFAALNPSYMLPIPYGQLPKTIETVFGVGDGEYGFKYRFLTGDEHGWRPQAVIYPAVDVSTGNADRGLDAGHIRVFLPV